MIDHHQAYIGKPSSLDTAGKVYRVGLLPDPSLSHVQYQDLGSCK